MNKSVLRKCGEDKNYDKGYCKEAANFLQIVACLSLIYFNDCLPLVNRPSLRAERSNL